MKKASLILFMLPVLSCSAQSSGKPLVRVGMNREEVMKLWGKPDRIVGNNNTWQWDIDNTKGIAKCAVMFAPLKAEELPNSPFAPGTVEAVFDGGVSDGEQLVVHDGRNGVIVDTIRFGRYDLNH